MTERHPVPTVELASYGIVALTACGEEKLAAQRIRLGDQRMMMEIDAMAMNCSDGQQRQANSIVMMCP